MLRPGDRVNAKRRLPVLQAPPSEDVPQRPPWQWSLFGAGLITLLWVVLTQLVAPVTRLVSESAPLGLLLQVGAQALASFFVGTVIGTWGPGKGVREGAWAGAISAMFAATCGIVVVASEGHASGTDVLVSAVGGMALAPSATLAGALGAWIGSRKKRVLTGA